MRHREPVERVRRKNYSATAPNRDKRCHCGIVKGIENLQMLLPSVVVDGLALRIADVLDGHEGEAPGVVAVGGELVLRLGTVARSRGAYGAARPWPRRDPSRRSARE